MEILNDNLNKEIIEWACSFLSSQGYTLENKLPESVKNTPWSCVLCFATSDGDIYLKQTPKLLGLEAIITKTLHDQFQFFVPEVIAHNDKLNCFLMKGAGKPLREILKKQFDVTLLCRAIDQFTSMQLVVSDHINIFLDLGVPDWRLDKLADLYMQLLLQKEVLTADGLSEVEIRELEKLFPTISNLCEKLSDYSIKQTMVQPDFHDNNILIDEISQAITFIDLGEIVISHPFFSLINCLYQAKKHHGLTEQDEAYKQLMNACLKNFIINESKEDLLDALTIARTLWFVYDALSQYRLMLACGQEKLSSFQHGRLKNSLKEVVAVISIEGNNETN